MPKTLVTGATGFIGSHVARELAQRGDDLRVTVRENSPTEALAEVQSRQEQITDEIQRAARDGR